MWGDDELREEGMFCHAFLRTMDPERAAAEVGKQDGFSALKRKGTQAMLEGTYPQKVLRDCPEYLNNMPENYQADLDKWFVPMDFIGVNYYVASRTQYDPTNPLHKVYICEISATYVR